jgi:hypothetical protein
LTNAHIPQSEVGMSEKISQSEQQLLKDIITCIETNRQQLAIAVNSTMSDLYWQIGKHIKTGLLGNEKAEYGKAIIKIFLLI